MPSLSASLALKSNCGHRCEETIFLPRVINTIPAPSINSQNGDRYVVLRARCRFKRSYIVFTPPTHGRAESPVIFWDSATRMFMKNNHQHAHSLPSTHRITSCRFQGSLRESSRQQDSASSLSIFRKPVPDTGTGSILLVSITAATSLHHHVELEEDFLVTLQQHFCNPQSVSAPVIFQYTRLTISHSSYHFNTGNTN